MRAVLVLAAASCAAMCGDPPATVPARAQPAAVTAAIHGRVRLRGPVPALEPLPFQSDPGVCGATRPNPWLRVDPSRGVADAVVYLADVPAEPSPPSSDTVNIDHVQCELSPRLQILRPGTTVVLRNSDPIFHSTRLRVAGTKLLPFGAGLLPAGQPYTPPTTRLYEPRFYELECTDGHALERGYLIVAAHRWYAITGADGSFVLDRVPPGRHTLAVWHPGWTFTIHQPDGLGRFAPHEVRTEVTVAAGATATVALDLP